MPRPKGSKNQKKTRRSDIADKCDKSAAYREEIGRLQSELDAAMLEINTLNGSIAAQREELHRKKAEQRRLEAKLSVLRERQAQADAEKEAEAMRDEASRIVTRLLASGKSADEIIGILAK